MVSQPPLTVTLPLRLCSEKVRPQKTQGSLKKLGNTPEPTIVDPPRMYQCAHVYVHIKMKTRGEGDIH